MAGPWALGSRWWALALVLPPATAGAQTLALEDVSDAIAAPIGADPPDAGDGVHGVAWLDADLDGDLDLFHTNGPGLPARLFRNDGPDGTGGTTFTEAAAQFGVDVTGGNAGVLAADLDGDGPTDLLLLGDASFYQPRPTPAVLLRNAGDGTFEDVTLPAGLAALLPVTHTFAAAGDIDGDGDLDVFIGAPGSLHHGRQDDNVLLRNDGWRFVEVTAEAGLVPGVGACAASFVHMDDDDAVDLVLANCSQVDYIHNPMQLFLNRGDGTFTEVSNERKLWAMGWWMSATVGDLDGDLALDLFSTNEGVTRNAPHALWLSAPDGVYEERTTALPLAGLNFGWGATAADLDNDGLLDLYFAGMDVVPVRLPEIANPGYALRNTGGAAFELVPQPFDLSAIPTSGLAAADYDGDGRVDLAIATSRHPATLAHHTPTLLHNVSEGGGSLTVRLQDAGPNAAAVGARIYGELPDGRRLRRDVIAGGSFLSTESPWPTFGLGSAEEVRLEVRWPDGAVEDFGWHAASSASVSLLRGSGAAPTLAADGPTASSGGCGCAGARGSGWGALLVLLVVCPTRRRLQPSPRPSPGGRGGVHLGPSQMTPLSPAPGERVGVRGAVARAQVRVDRPARSPSPPQRGRGSG